MGKIMIASHRGRFGGNIVENTLPAFEAALRCGADIVETDVRKTRDGELILFHDPCPARLLGLPGRTEDYTIAELRAQPLRNVIGEPSGLYVNTLSELLAALKGRTLINLDQCWPFIDEVYARVKAMGMADQALIKSRPPYDGALSWLERERWAPRFIPVIPSDRDIPRFEALPPQAKLWTVEVFARTEEDRVISPDFVGGLRRRGLGLWINALSLAQDVTLCAGHDDTLSMTVSPDEGWGWLIARGATAIQTDWPLELKTYLEKRAVF